MPTISDGRAQFMVETAEGYGAAMGHLAEVLSGIGASGQKVARGHIELQYLRSSDAGFAERVQVVSKKLLNVNFPTSAPVLTDFAYLADFEMDGHPVQLNIGVVRKDEISRRVKGTVLNPPDVATFCNVSTTWGPVASATDVTNALDRTLSLGGRVIFELEEKDGDS